MPTARKLWLFLDHSKKIVQDRPELLKSLAEYTAEQVRGSNDSALYDLLKRYGWDDAHSRFDNSLDIEKLRDGLRKLAERREHKASCVRVSQVGLRNTIKSFAPDTLMAYTLENGFHLDEVPLVPFSVFFDGVVLIADISGMYNYIKCNVFI
jgi:hypothetical protein